MLRMDEVGILMVDVQQILKHPQHQSWYGEHLTQ